MDALYWLSLPFVNAFNFSDILIYPLIVALIAAVIYAVLGRLKSFQFGILDGFLGVFLSSVFLSVCFNVNSMDAKGFNHLMAVYVSYFVFYYLAVKISSRLGVERILFILWVGYIFATVFGLFEFSLVNFFGVDFSFIPRPTVSEYNPGFLDVLLIRSRSLFEESGYYAAYLSIVAPLLVYYLWWLKPSRIGKASFVVLSLSSYFVAFSVSLFIFMPFAVFVSFLMHSVVNWRINRKHLWVFGVILSIVIVVYSSDALMDILFYTKFSSGSFDDRNEKFAATLKLMVDADSLNQIFGYGPGSYYRLGVLPAISVYLNYWRDFGLLGLGTYLVFIFVFLRSCCSDRSVLGKAIFISAILIQLYYISMPTYFLPVYFIPLVLHKIKMSRAREVKTSKRAFETLEVSTA